MFDDVLQKGTFPSKRNTSVVKPMYKVKVDRASSASKRDYSCNKLCCLGNLLASILQSTLNKTNQQNHFLSPGQFTFRPKVRTKGFFFLATTP